MFLDPNKFAVKKKKKDPNKFVNFHFSSYNNFHSL